MSVEAARTGRRTTAGAETARRGVAGGQDGPVLRECGCSPSDREKWQIHPDTEMSRRKPPQCPPLAQKRAKARRAVLSRVVVAHY